MSVLPAGFALSTLAHARWRDKDTESCEQLRTAKKRQKSIILVPKIVLPHRLKSPSFKGFDTIAGALLVVLLQACMRRPRRFSTGSKAGARLIKQSPLFIDVKMGSSVVFGTSKRYFGHKKIRAPSITTQTLVEKIFVPPLTPYLISNDVQIHHVRVGVFIQRRLVL